MKANETDLCKTANSAFSRSVYSKLAYNFPVLFIEQFSFKICCGFGQCVTFVYHDGYKIFKVARFSHMKQVQGKVSSCDLKQKWGHICNPATQHDQ